MRHTTEYTRIGMSQWIGRCTCGERFGTEDEPLRNKQAVEDATFHHHREVEVKRAKISGRQPNLETTYQHYREQADDPQNSERDRALWAQLADEIADRLGLNAPAYDEPELPLFD